MKLRATILSGHSRPLCSRIVNWVGNNPSRFDELVNLFLYDDPLVVQRAGWPLSEVVRLHPSLIRQQLGPVLAYFNQPGLHDAVKRNTLRLLQYIVIPEEYHGRIMNQCFDFIISPAEKPAIKAYSLTVLQHLSHQYPEIRPELKMVIEDRWEFETPAFHTRAKKILKEIG